MNLLEHIRSNTIISTADVPAFAIYCVSLFAFRYIMTTYVLSKLGKMLKQKRLMKFVHRSYDLMHYLTSAFIGLLALTQTPYGHCVYWAKECKDILMPTEDAFKCTLIEKIYYLSFAGYYVVDIFYIWTSSEIGMMIVHHIATLSMIFFAIILRVPAIGLSVMLLHDVVDVPLYLGKILLYLNFHQAKDMCLYAFALMCTYFRVTNYPILVYNIWMNYKHITRLRPLYFFTATLLLVLYGLHLIWKYKIFTNVVEIFQGKGVHDNRSDKATGKKNN